MADSYDFLAPGRIVFGWGRRRELGKLAHGLGQRALLIRGQHSFSDDKERESLRADLMSHGVKVVEAIVSRGEPTVEAVDRAVLEIRRLNPSPGDFVLAIGGGATLDLGKGVAALATNTDGMSVRDYLEGVGRGIALSSPPLPLIALPTTAGTGTEATKNAVISVKDPPCKKSLRSEQLIPRLALIDPELAVSCPPAVTAASGLDAITQLIESYISPRAKPIPQALARHALPRALRALPRVFHDPNDREAREAMAEAALFSGLALANSGLGMAHGVAAALGVVRDVPHGLACAVMLPAALRANRQVASRRLAELAEVCFHRGFDSDWDAADALIARTEDLLLEVSVPCRLSEIGVLRDDIPSLVSGSRGNSMDGNPRPIDDSELTEILEAML